MLLDANLLLYAVDRTSPPVRVERALMGPAVILAEQVRLRGASRTAAAAVLPLAGLAAIVVAGPVRVLSPLHISRSRRQHSSEDDAPSEPRLLKRCLLRRRLARPYVGPGTKMDKDISVAAQSASV